MSTQKTSPSSLVQNKEKKVAGAAAVAARLRGKGAMLAEESLLAAAAQSASPELPKGLAKEGAAEVADLDLAQDKPGVIDGQDKVELTYEQTSSSPSQTWTLAQASTSTATDASASAAPACQDSAGKACDDDDKGGAWWGADVGSWLKLGLAGGALLLASGSGSQNDDTSKLSTAMAAGPFKASGMTLAYFGTGGLLLELSWDENGVLTKTVNAALNGDVQIQTSKVMVDGQEQVVVTGVVVDFANYTGTLMAVLFDKADSVPLEFYDEVAGLISLEESALHAVTTINKGQNFLAITPFTELALRMAGVETATLDQTQEITSLLQDKAQLALVDDANKTVSQWVGVDIVNVLPVAVNDVGFVSATDLLAKNYGEKLAALARLVPGNLEGSIEKLLQSDPDAAPTLIAQALTDYKDDVQSSTTPASVEIDRSVWINMQEGARPLLIRGASSDADDGSVVRITIYKDGVALLSVKAEVQGDAWQVTLPQTLSQMGVQDGDALTIRAYIDPDYPDEATTRYDATPPATPQFAPDLQAHQDSGISSLDNVTREQSPDLYVGPLPADVAAVELLVDGEPVAATYNARSGTLRPNVSLEDGVHRISYRWIDAAGNVGLPSPKLLTTVDSFAPARMLNIDISDDSGISASDFMTNVTTQTVTGQLSAPLSTGDRVWASIDGGANWLEVTGSVDADGRLSWSGVRLNEGISSLQFKTTDVSGNTSQVTAQAYRLDTTPPDITVNPIALSADTGSSASDFVTRQVVQQVSGQLIENGQPQTLLPGDRLMASSDGGSTWQDITASVRGSTFTWSGVSLNGGVDGSNSLRFQVIDAVENRGPITVQNYRLDTVAPVGPENFAWATYPQGISSGGNSVTGLIGDVPFTYTLTDLNQGPLNLNSTGNMYNQGIFPAGYHVPGGTTIRNDFASVNTLTFDVPMNNPVLVFSSIGNPSTPVSIEFPQGVEILWSNNVTVAQGTSSAATRVTGTEGSLVVRFNGSTNEFVFKYLSPETYVNFAFGAAVFDLLSAEQDTGIKDIDDVTQVTRPAFQIQNIPSDAVSTELLIDGRAVSATFDAQDNTLTPNTALADGVYDVAYRFVDLAGNVSAPGSVTQVTIDTRAPVNTGLTTFTSDAIGGTYEPGTALSLKINGVSIASNRLQLDATHRTWTLVPSSGELNDATTGLLVKETSTFELTATDVAGNVSTASKTMNKDAFNAPYVKEFIPADGGFLANDSTGSATLNLVFSKSVSAGAGHIYLWKVNGDVQVAAINVTGPDVDIVDGTDVYITLPELTTGERYYVTLDAGTFEDAAGKQYQGQSDVGVAGWDFEGAQASIAPDFVAQDDIINLSESAALVRITGKVVSSANILRDVIAGDLTVSVDEPQAADPVNATLLSYNNETGQFVFTVPAQVWASGNYGYTVTLQGSTGSAAGVSAAYSFADLAVDLVAPAGIVSSLDSITDDVGQLQGNLFPSSYKLLESGYASTTGTVKVTDLNVADLDLSKLSITMMGAYLSPTGAPGVYNSGSTVYNSNQTSVSFWVQTISDPQYTKAVKLQLTDTANGIELRIVEAKYLSGAIASTYNWNSGGTSMIVATTATGNGYGLSGLAFEGNNMSAAMQGTGSTDDTTPVLAGTLTRALAQGERIAIDRTDGQGQTVTITGKAGLIVDGTSWSFNDGVLADGQYTYRVYVEDLAGNRTVASQARTIHVDTNAPTTMVDSVVLARDTGSSNTDQLTHVAAQTISGTLDAELAAGERLMASLDGGVTYTDITASVSATAFSWSGATLNDGDGKITLRVVDAMGGTGPIFEQTYTLDRTPPAASTVQTLTVDVEAAKVLNGHVALDAGDRVQLEVNGAIYQITPDSQGDWTLNLDSDRPSSGALRPWAAGRYEVVVTVTDAAGNTAVDASTQEVTLTSQGMAPPLPTVSVDARVTSYGLLSPNINPRDEFGNVLIKESSGGFTVPLGVTVLDETTTFTGSVGLWSVTQGTSNKLGPLPTGGYYWTTKWPTVYSPNLPTATQGTYALQVTSAEDNTPAAIAQFLRLNAITAKSDANDKFYLVLNADDIDGTGESGAVVVYVDETLNSLASIDASAIRVIGSYAGHRASEFTALNFSRLNNSEPMPTVWIDNSLDSSISGTLANDMLYGGAGADVIKGNGGYDSIVLTNDDKSDLVYFQNVPGFTYVKDFQTTAVLRDQLDFSEFGFYRENVEILPSQATYGYAYNNFPKHINVSGKILGASYMYQGGFITNGIFDSDTFGMADTVSEVKRLFTSEFLVLDNDAQAIVLTPSNGVFTYVYHVQDIDPSSAIDMSVTPLGMVWGGMLYSWAPENFTARPVVQSDYITIGRLDADRSAFGAWFDTNKDGVHDAGEQTISTTTVDDPYAEQYYYTLDGVDFAQGDYTVRFVDMAYGFSTGLDVDSLHGVKLDLSLQGFGTGDQVIVDMATNSSDWMGLHASDVLSGFTTPTATRQGNQDGAYADNIDAIYDPVSSVANTGRFGQLMAGVRPDVDGAQSTAAYVRLDAYADGESVNVDLFRYQPPANSSNSGGVWGDTYRELVYLGVPITQDNLTIIV